MLNPEPEAALNAQLGGELYSSHLYLSMSAFCESANMLGAAHWFRMQADEERTHATRFFDHLVDRGGRVALGTIEAPPTEFRLLLDAFEHARGRTQRERRDRPAGRRWRSRRATTPPRPSSSGS